MTSRSILLANSFSLSFLTSASINGAYSLWASLAFFLPSASVSSVHGPSGVITLGIRGNITSADVGLTSNSGVVGMSVDDIGGLSSWVPSTFVDGSALSVFASSTWFAVFSYATALSVFVSFSVFSVMTS